MAAFCDWSRNLGKNSEYKHFSDTKIIRSLSLNTPFSQLLVCIFLPTQKLFFRKMFFYVTGLTLTHSTYLPGAIEPCIGLEVTKIRSQLVKKT
jgi:hypothetical protein